MLIEEASRTRELCNFFLNDGFRKWQFGFLKQGVAELGLNGIANMRIGSCGESVNHVWVGSRQL